MRTRAIGRPMLAAVLLLTGARPLLAAGFALKEQSTTAQGNAFAGATAGADDVSYMFFNPAALGYDGQVELQALATVVAPKAELNTRRAAPCSARRSPAARTTAISPRTRSCRRSTRRRRCRAGCALGLGVNVPFGLETQYSRDWVGRYHARQVRAPDASTSTRPWPGAR